MKVSEIANLFPKGTIGEAKSIAYLKDEKLYDLIYDSTQFQEERIKPKFRDLARLHKVVRDRKAFSAVEFGVGYSTVVIADALKKNETEWDRLNDKPEIRTEVCFKLFSIDAGKTWIESTKRLLPQFLKAYVQFQVSAVKASYFNNRSCHYYETLPDVIPDFIYIDGPDPSTVSGKLRGISWTSKARIVMAADLLSIEPLLLPGTLVLIDGRTLNARFLAAHLFRRWKIMRSEKNDVTAMELQERPLGYINRNILRYQLGEIADSWPEPLNRISRDETQI